MASRKLPPQGKGAKRKGVQNATSTLGKAIAAQQNSHRLGKNAGWGSRKVNG